ncbi:MAG TPA: hypothetical protein VIP46_18790, partial [Pyrinomonadaceae bacterium]
MVFWLTGRQTFYVPLIFLRATASTASGSGPDERSARGRVKICAPMSDETDDNRCPRCSSARLRAWGELTDDEREVVRRLPAAA